MTKTPFKFLDSYTRDDQEIFFGREKEVEELYFKIFEGNLLIVYGSSGTGKTSLIQCGLASKFNDADWMPIIIRRGNDINESVKKTLQQVALTPLRKKNSLTEDIQSIYLDHFKPLYFLFDQFEELFIFGTDEEIETFTNNLKIATESGLTCKFIFVIRGEYLENISRFEEKIPDFFNNRIRIERMTRKNAARVITEPCHIFNIGISDDFPAKVLEKLSNDKSSVELTYLQVYLDKIYKKAVAKNPDKPIFDTDLLQELGRIDDVLASFLDEQIAKTNNPEEALMVLKSFVSNEGTKKQMSVDDVLDFIYAIGKKMQKDSIESFIHQFVDLRILKDKDENGKYELRHDALAAKIFEQISYTEKELLEVRNFILNRYNDFKKRGTYLEHSDIQYIKPYERKMFLNDEQKEFVEKSMKLSRQKKLRQRNIFIGIAMLIFITLACFSLFALKQRDEAILQTHIAEQRTREALNQKAQAEKAQEDAMKASKEAMSAESFAKLQEQIANDKSKMAEDQKLVAEKEALNAKNQSELATQQKSIAEQQKQTAEQEKQKADLERKKAEDAQLQADRLRLIALSQAVAFKAIQIKNNPQLCALLGCASYALAKDNEGSTQDPQIFSALYQGIKGINPSYPPEVHVPAETKAMNISTDGKIAAFFADGSINTYSEGNKPGTSIRLNADNINTGYLSEGGKYAITAYDDNSIKIWNVSSNSSSPALYGHTGLVRAAAFSNDGSMFVTGGRDSAVIVWINNQASKKINLSSRIRALALSPDKSKIIAGCEDGIVYIYNVAANSKSTLTSIASGRIESVVYSSGGKYLIVSASNGNISIFNANGTPIKTITESADVEFLAANDAGGLLAEVTSNRIIRIYNLNDLSQKPVEINDNKNKILAMALTAQGNIYVACANNVIREFPVKSASIQNILYNLVNRNLSQDEWNTYIGKDIPYKKINPDLKQ